MDRKILQRFGLAIAVLALSLPITVLAQTKPAGTTAQQVIVTNTSAQPVPVQPNAKEFFQASDSTGCQSTDVVHFTFNIPAGKKLILQQVNLLANTTNIGQTFGAGILADSLNYWSIPMQQFGGGTQDWVADRQVQIIATQTVRVDVRRSAIVTGQCAVGVQLGGELVPAP